MNRFGLLVSTWNDAVTGYDFGIQEKEYSSKNRPRYTAYLHTDRTYYRSGDTVHIHALIRENNVSLRIPTDVSYDLIVTNA